MRHVSEILEGMERRSRDLHAMTASVQAPEALRLGVLLVDDEPLWLKYAAREIPSEPVYQALDTDRAIQMLEEHDDIAVVVTDIRMPATRDGIWLIQQVAQRWPHIQVVAISAYSDQEKAVRSKVVRFLHKPVQVRALASLVAGLVLRGA